MTINGKITIHYHRVNKPSVDFVEGFVEEDAERLVTYSRVPEEHAAWLTSELVRQGLIAPGQTVGALRKHLFFMRHFTLLEFLDRDDGLLGYYSDVALPMRRVGDGYEIDDLMLDLWVTPQGAYTVLDRDELEEAEAAGQITAEKAALAERVLAEMIAELEAGIFPARYLE